jgi:hypothetical protein
VSARSASDVAFAASEDFSATSAWGAVKYGVEKSTRFARAGVIEIWLTSKSNFFGPGA